MKLIQGGFLLALAIGVLHFIDRSIDIETARGLAHLNVDLDSPWVQRLLDRLGHVDNRQLKTLSTGSFVYSLLLLIEGSGLCLLKRWGDYFTILVTGSFLPLELYECVHRFSPLPVGVLLLNAVVLGYLVVRVVREHKQHA
jgi:uncharacterized membrane protein (DUF2068 family)